MVRLIPSLNLWFVSILGFFGGKGLQIDLLRAGAGNAVVLILSRVLSLVLGVILARNLGADGYGPPC